MNKFLLTFFFCLALQRTYSKSIFDYNINPEYDLVAQESGVRYSNFRPSSEFHVSPRRRYKHHASEREHGGTHGKRKHVLPSHSSEPSDGYLYPEPDASDEYDYFDQTYHSPYYHHPHGVRAGQDKYHGQSFGHQYVIPPRFPPPPVYDKHFLNPWTLSATPSKPFIGQSPLFTTSRPVFKQHPFLTTPAVYVAPKLTTTTTQAPLTSTTADDQLMYDIDVRFGRD